MTEPTNTPTPEANQPVSFAAGIKPTEDLKSPVASTLREVQLQNREGLYTFIEDKWMKQLSYVALTLEQRTACENIENAIKDCVKILIRNLPSGSGSDRGLGQIEVAQMILKKAVSQNPGWYQQPVVDEDETQEQTKDDK